MTCLFAAQIQLFLCLFGGPKHIFGFSELPGHGDRRYRPCRSVPHDMEEAVLQIAPGFMTFQPKSVASLA